MLFGLDNLFQLAFELTDPCCYGRNIYIYILPEHYLLSLFSLPLALWIGQVRDWHHCPHFTVEVTKDQKGLRMCRRHNETWPRSPVFHPSSLPRSTLPQGRAPEVSLLSSQLKVSPQPAHGAGT